MSGYSASNNYAYDQHRQNGRGIGSVLLKGVGIILWGLISFGLTFVELVAEVVAPLLLLLGGLWWAASQMLSKLPVPAEVQPALQAFPTQLEAAGYVLTPTGLIIQGLWLLAVVAACRTLNSIIFKET
ncbi:hypothetical protein HMPREF9946_02328 [Acetobacteraceae bacterium AT-5844]|nr:hypothetical protein HMPREF9946_02328 [Acetobacteraceae bacterium AT-5844]